MADEKPKPAIPAWQQRAQPDTPAVRTDEGVKTDDGVKKECTGTPPTIDTPESIETGLPAASEPAAALAAEEATATDAASSTQLENMRTFLEDPAVKAASPEKKRAFFESKGIASELINQALNCDTTFNAGDFESFEQTEAQAVQAVQPVQSVQPAQTPQAPAQQAPPIITYPEFLVEAHKPAPLVTPGRVLNTAYFAASVYALLYGASKYLITPMAMSLSDARHDFSQHSQSKLDEMNERLEKLVTKLPEAKKEKAALTDAETESDNSSDISDPTELYHRDMGTQTSPEPSRRPSSSEFSIPGLESSEKKKDSLTRATDTMGILQSHLNEMLSRSEGLEQLNKDRQESMNRLRTYLDNLMFASPNGYGMWSTPDDDGQKKDGKAEEDVIEDVKKEIRGVKGVLLSAKRFPGVGGRAGG